MSNDHQTEKRFTIFGDLKSWLLDSPEARAQRTAAKEAAQNGLTAPASDSTGKPNPTVSRRARQLAGKRTRALGITAVAVGIAILTIINTILLATRPTTDDIDLAVETALREQGAQFPTGQAVLWAEQVAIDWGTWDEADPEEREVRMAQHLTSGMDPQAGWNRQGTQQVVSTSVNPEPYIVDQHHALVDVSYRLEDQSRWCITVPLYATRPEGLAGENVTWAFALSGNPVPKPCAPRTGAVDDITPADGTLRPNEELAQQLTAEFFPGFFAAWAASDAASLRQYSAPGVSTIGLGGAMTSTPPPSISDVEVLTPTEGPRPGTVYHAHVPVMWTLAGSTSQITATYDVPIKLSGDRWYVAGEPTPSPRSSEAESGAPAADVQPPQEQASPGPDGEDYSPTPRPEDAPGEDNADGPDNSEVPGESGP